MFPWYYVIDEKTGEPRATYDVTEWNRWFETAERHVAEDTVGGVRVSTVFLGLDHSFGGGVPVLYETMIFGGLHDQYQERYSSRADALNRHRAITSRLRDNEPIE